MNEQGFEIRGHHFEYYRDQVLYSTAAKTVVNFMRSRWLGDGDTSNWYKKDTRGGQRGVFGTSRTDLRLVENFKLFDTLSDDATVLLTNTRDRICNQCELGRHCLEFNRQDDINALKHYLVYALGQNTNQGDTLPQVTMELIDPTTYKSTAIHTPEEVKWIRNERGEIQFSVNNEGIVFESGKLSIATTKEQFKRYLIAGFPVFTQKTF